VVFFVSYIIVAGYFLLNIVVAVLLDEFVNSVNEEREAMAKVRFRFVEGIFFPPFSKHIFCEKGHFSERGFVCPYVLIGHGAFKCDMTHSYMT